MARFWVFAIVVASVAALWVRGDERNSESAVTSARETQLERIENAQLPNAFRVAEKVISGGQPDGEQAFVALKALGVKTIISVDGAKPAVELAEKYGLRYVHLPHGYDGVPERRAMELAKAVRDLPGPIYIHCHHGHHRSPAASAVACVAVGFLKPEAALLVLKIGGTSEHYRGLYQSVKAAQRIDDKRLDQLKTDFPATAKLPPIADAMVEIEQTHDRLKALAANEWGRLPNQPDLDAAHEALLLKEHYQELLRTDEVQGQSAEFQMLLASSQREASILESQMRAWLAGSAASPPTDVRRSFAAVSRSCANCHQKFRDVPLTEK